MIEYRDINVAHLFCGLGGGAKGFNRGQARVGNLVARFRCLGGIDVDPASCRDFETLAGVPATCLDLFTREQYEAFHGHAPPAGWREMVPDDIRRAFGNQHPHILFLSAPCKGFSGLLSESKSASAKYQALNALTLRGVWLALEAFRDDPIELIVFENVPRIATRGRPLLDQITALLRAYGFAVSETAIRVKAKTVRVPGTFHDCGEIGNLAQSRKRFLLLARHQAKVPNFLYEPVKHRLRGVGEVLDRLPVPLSGMGGAMHRMPALQWKTWVRLALVEAGHDWRSLNKLRVVDGVLADIGILPEAGRHGGFLGVRRWSEPTGTVTSRGYPNTGAFSVADPRVDGHPKSVQLGVRSWAEPAGVITGKMFAGGGPNAVADPRVEGVRYNSAFRVVRYGETSPAVAGPGGPAGGLSVADPRSPGSSAMGVADPWPPEASGKGKYRVTGYGESAGCVIAASTTGQGAFAVADARFDWHPGASSSKLRVTPWLGSARPITGSQQVGSGAGAVADPRPAALSDPERDAYLTGGHYGVVDWCGPSGAVPAHAKNNNGPWSVADPRVSREDYCPRCGVIESSCVCNYAEQLPAADARLVCVIRALDGTWHRPFTTLELAALQGLVDPDEYLELDGLSDSAWRERIGNAVPPPAAAAIAGVMGRTLLAAWSGETFQLSSEPIWVRPVVAALMAGQGGEA